MNPKIRELAEKLLALAQRGVGGEKDNAQQALDRHLKKYGVTLDDLIGPNLIYVDFDMDNAGPIPKTKFINQVVASVLGGKRSLDHSMFKYEKSGNHFIRYNNLTPAEAVEIQAKVDFYWADYLEQTKLFYATYVQTNELWAKPEPGQEPVPVDAETARKMRAMGLGIDQKKFHKQIK